MATEYWDDFYKNWDLSIPSQFAVFIANEIPRASRIVEFGCGSGRDSFFFATHGMQVRAFDNSAIAIERNAAQAKALGDCPIAFETLDINQLDAAMLASDTPTIAYARFFLHAIDAERCTALLSLLAGALRPGSLVCLEYRTLEDAANAKTFGNHYRRYIDHPALIEELRGMGFAIDYAHCGIGIAKFHDEDPSVGRIIARLG